VVADAVAVAALDRNLAGGGAPERLEGALGERRQLGTVRAGIDDPRLALAAVAGALAQVLGGPAGRPRVVVVWVSAPPELVLSVALSEPPGCWMISSKQPPVRPMRRERSSVRVPFMAFSKIT
jgi:hypothetical protein